MIEAEQAGEWGELVRDLESAAHVEDIAFRASLENIGFRTDEAEQMSVNSKLLRQAARAIALLQQEREGLRKACAPFVREAALWPEYCRDSDAVFIADVDDVEPLLEEAAAEGHGRITYSKDVTVGDLRELARAVKEGEENAR